MVSFRNLLPALLIMLIPSIVQAEPSKTPRFLMDEPMSLWDWGFYQLRKRVDRLEGKKIGEALFTFGAATYDWDKNRIIIEGVFSGESTQKSCVNTINKFKGTLASTYSSPERLLVNAERLFTSMFSHAGGYQSTKRPDDFGKQLIKIVLFEIYIHDIKKENSSISCTGTYLSDNVSIVVK